MNKSKYLQSITQRISNNVKVSAKMKDYNNGYEATEIETRSAYEKMNDKNYIFQNLRDKVIKLFNNDTEMSEEFMNLLAGSSITPEDFELAYNQLVTNFSGKIVEPADVMTNLRKLVDNFQESGVSSQPGNNNQVVPYNPQDVQQMIQDAITTVQQGYKNNEITKVEAKDSHQKLEAFHELMSRLHSLMSQPFANRYDENEKDGMLKYARNNEALQDIVKILVSGQPDDTNSTDNLEMLISKLEKVKVETFKRWAKNMNSAMKSEMVTSVKGKAKEAKKANQEELDDYDLNEEIGELEKIYFEGLIDSNPVESSENKLATTRCTKCGHRYLKGWKKAHDKTDRHLRDM